MVLKIVSLDTLLVLVWIHKLMTISMQNLVLASFVQLTNFFAPPACPTDLTVLTLQVFLKSRTDFSCVLFL